MYINRKVDWVYYFVFSQLGDSPLHHAASYGRLQIVKLLIQNGASSTQCNNVSVIVKQVIHVPLCAHVQARCTVVCVFDVHVHVCVFHVYFFKINISECSVHCKLYYPSEDCNWSTVTSREMKHESASGCNIGYFPSMGDITNFYIPLKLCFKATASAINQLQYTQCM